MNFKTECSAIYYVESAPQLISAYRHLMQCELSSPTIVIRFNGSIYNDQQIDKVIEILDLANSATLYKAKLGWRLFAIILQLFRKYRFSKICICDVRSYVSLFVILISNAPSILLDDGIASIDFYLRREKSDHLVERGAQRLFEPLMKDKLSRIVLHSNLPLPSTSKVVVEINRVSFSTLTNARNPIVNSHEAIFIGSKVVEAGICSKGYLVEVLNHFVKNFPADKHVYIPHREESTTKLKTVNNLEIRRLGLPIELEYGLNHAIPAIVCSFNSGGVVPFLQYREIIGIYSYLLPLTDVNVQFHESIRAAQYLFENVLEIDSIDIQGF